MALRYLTAGESHGPGLTAVVEGFPAGVPIDIAAINRDLARRMQGYGRGGRMKIERDDEEPPGPSVTRQAALDALRADPDRPITFGQLAELATRECCACGLSSAPAVCEECPNLHLLRAVLRKQPRCV